MGAERFGYLRGMLPGETTILGVDEHTACVLDPNIREGMALGAGALAIIRGQAESLVPSSEHFSFDLL
jgi:hypothetical protein